MDVTFHNTDTHISATCSGQWELGALLELVANVRAAADEASLKRILILMEAVSNPTAQFDRFLIGKEVAEKLSGYRVAAVCRKEMINKFAEDAAVNRGATLLVTDSEEEALTWLFE